MNKKRRFYITLLAAMLCMAAFSTVAYADEGEESEPTATPNPFTSAGTGTVVDTATDEDGKEFYTIITPDEHVFYLIIDRQRGAENVYFLDVVTEKDLLSLAGGAEDKEIVVFKSTPEPTAQPGQDVQPESEQQSYTGGIVAVALIVAVIAGVAVYFFKLRKTRKAKGKPTLDEYDSDEDEEELDDDEAWNDDVETEDDEL